MTRMTAEEFNAMTARHGFKKANKYGAKRTEVDGLWFDSRLEARRYEELKLLLKSCAVKWFIRQVPFDLPGGIRYRADFLVVWAWKPGHWGGVPVPMHTEPVTVEDCKGARTRVSINKIKQVEALYGIKIEIITRTRYPK